MAAMSILNTLLQLGQKIYLQVSTTQHSILFVWSTVHWSVGTETHWVTVQVVQVDNNTRMCFRKFRYTDESYALSLGPCKF